VHSAQTNELTIFFVHENAGYVSQHSTWHCCFGRSVRFLVAISNCFTSRHGGCFGILHLSDNYRQEEGIVNGIEGVLPKPDGNFR
jgi:hypothetical protein